LRAVQIVAEPWSRIGTVANTQDGEKEDDIEKHLDDTEKRVSVKKKKYARQRTKNQQPGQIFSMIVVST
jgi:hypothetical protein